MNLLPNIFNRGGSKEPITRPRITPQMVVNSTPLPSPDFAQLVVKNEYIPDEVKAEHWAGDLTSAALNNFTSEQRERIARKHRIRTMVKEQFTPILPIWWPGTNLEKENKDLDYDLAFDIQTYKSMKDRTDGRNAITMLTSGHQILETKDTTDLNNAQKAKQILGI